LVSPGIILSHLLQNYRVKKLKRLYESTQT